ncbi:MAG: SAF domain-containing protein [Acidimicrobiales bacterium]
MTTTTAPSRGPAESTAATGGAPGRRPGSPGGRTIRPHRALPSSRAVVGALLVTLAAVGAFAMSRQGNGAPTTRYVVMASAVAPGARIKASDVETRAMELDTQVAEQTFAAVDRVIGAVALAPMNAGQLVQEADLALATKVDGQVLVGHELTFPVERDRVPQNLRRGETVAVLATYGAGSDARTTTTAQQAVVLSFDTDGDTIGTKRSARLTVLLSDPSMVIETAHASQAADITIVRTTQADAALPSSFRPSVVSTTTEAKSP